MSSLPNPPYDEKYGRDTFGNATVDDAVANDAVSNKDSVELLGEKSPGVQRIEQVASQMNRTNKICLFVGVLLIAYAYGLDIDTRYSYNVSCLCPLILC